MRSLPLLKYMRLGSASGRRFNPMPRGNGLAPSLRRLPAPMIQLVMSFHVLVARVSCGTLRWFRSVLPRNPDQQPTSRRIAMAWLRSSSPGRNPCCSRKQSALCMETVLGYAMRKVSDLNKHPHPHPHSSRYLICVVSGHYGVSELRIHQFPHRDDLVAAEMEASGINSVIPLTVY